MIRGVVVTAIMLSGCGRVRFAPSEAGSDSAVDVMAPAVCGNGECEGRSGETCTGCTADCATAAPVCGNGVCNAGEDSASCLTDCGLEPWPAAWQPPADVILAELNSHRMAGTDCPSTVHGPVAPLALDPALQVLARQHVWHTSHEGYGTSGGELCNGQTVFEVLAAAGYPTAGGTARYTNEANGTDPYAAIALWMSFEPLCNIIMSSNLTVVATAFANEKLPSFVAFYH